MQSNNARWYVLFVFSLFAYLQGALWMTFSCVPKSTEQNYHVGKDQVRHPPLTYSFHCLRRFDVLYCNQQIDLLLNWGPIIYVVLIPITTWLLTKHRGFNRTAILGYFLTFAGSIVRAIPSVVPSRKGTDLRRGKGGLALLHVGQILNAAGGPIALGAATRMSAEWFPEGQRTRATAIVFVSNALGVAVTFILGPYIVLWTSLAVLLYLLAGLSTIPFVCSLIYFPSPPGERFREEAAQEHGSKSNQATAPLLRHQQGIDEYNTVVTRAAFLPGVTAVLKNYSVVVLCLGSGIMGGVVNAYLGVLPTALNDVGESELQGDRLNSINIFAGVVGGIVLADLADRFFQRRLKDMLIVIFITSFVFLSGLVYTVNLRPDLYWLQDLFALVAGLFQVN